MNEATGADGGGVNYEGQSAYDVADMLKQYFRDLPEPLLTSKLSETFLQIYQCKRGHTVSEHGVLFWTAAHAHTLKCIPREFRTCYCFKPSLNFSVRSLA